MKETITISDTFQSPILSQACGVEVTITITGSLTVLTVPDRPVGPQDLTIANIKWVAAVATTRCGSGT